MCSISKCQNPIYNNNVYGYCRKHFRRNKIYGDPLYTKITDREDTKSFIEKALKYKNKNQCLIWPYFRNKKGYAASNKGLVHRIICKRVNGDNPKNKPLALHSCGNGNLGCINPHHLYWGDRYDNSSDQIKHGTRVNGEKHGGHKLSAKDVISIRNLYELNYTMQNLSDIFNVCIATIHKIIHYKSWKHLLKPND